MSLSDVASSVDPNSKGNIATSHEVAKFAISSLDPIDCFPSETRQPNSSLKSSSSALPGADSVTDTNDCTQDTSSMPDLDEFEDAEDAFSESPQVITKRTKKEKRKHADGDDKNSTKPKTSKLVEEPQVENDETRRSTKKKTKNSRGAKPNGSQEKEEDDLPRPTAALKNDTDVDGIKESFASSIVKSKTKNSHEQPQDVNIERFLKAFKELFPILRLLGTAFYFVEKDIDQKVAAIQANQAAQEGNHHSTNLIDFVEWERKNGTIRTKHSTGRHTLRLMRALNFISIFLDKLNDPNVEPKPAAKEAYELTLSMHHPWSVRTAVSMAFYTLPYRKTFLQKLDLDTEASGPFRGFVDATSAVYKILDTYYKTHQLHDLA